MKKRAIIVVLILMVCCLSITLSTFAEAESIRFLDPNELKILSTPPVNAKVETAYRYTPIVQGNEPFQWTLVQCPDNMSIIDPNSGEIGWTPTIDQIGEHEIFLKVEANGKVVSQYWTIKVSLITSTPPNSVKVDTLYEYSPTLPGSWKGEWYIFPPDSEPEGMLLDSNTGAIQWTPSPNQIGDYEINLTVFVKIDAHNNVDYTQTWIIGVEPAIITTPPVSAKPIVGYSYQPEANGVGDMLWDLLEAPDGMSTSQFTGKIVWTPLIEQIGTHTVELRVTINKKSTIQSWEITVNPYIVTTPLNSARVGVEYSYNPQLLGVGETEWELENPPDGMLIDNKTGKITWTPTTNQAGVNIVILWARINGKPVTQTWTVTVYLFSSTPPSFVQLNDIYTYSPVIKSSEKIEWSLIESPEGMKVDPNSGKITWAPNSSQVGSFTVQLKAAVAGKEEVQEWTIDIDPLITSAPPGSSLAVNSCYSYTPDVLGTGVIQWYLLNAPQGMSIDPNGTVRWTPTASQIGHYTVSLRVEVNGKIDIQSLIFDIKPLINSTPPALANVGVEFRYLPTVIGEGIQEWTLAQKPAGMAIDPNNGEITWTPSAEQVGENTIKLKVSINGEENTQTWKMEVKLLSSFGNNKSGGCFISVIKKRTDVNQLRLIF